MAEHEGFDDDGPEFRPPLPPEDRIWRHPAEMGATSSPHAAASLDVGRNRGHSPWTVGFVSVIGGVLLAGSLMFGVGGLGDDPGRIALRPVATLAPRATPRQDVPVADRIAPDPPEAVVGVEVAAPTEVRVGNGVVIRGGGYVVTTASLISGALSIVVTSDDGARHPAVQVGVDAINDLAVLHVEGVILPDAVDLDRSTVTSVGASIHVFGAARDVGAASWATTVVSTRARLSVGACDLHEAVQLEDELDVSAAGAIALDDSGRLVGLVTSCQPGERAIVVPTRTLRSVTDQLIATGHARHGWLGIEGATLTDDGGTTAGALVERVIDGSPAQVSGLLPADVVISVDGVPIDSMGSLVVEVRERTPGTTVSLGILREGVRTDIPVALADTAPT